MSNYGHYSFRENLLEIRCVCSVKLPINCAAWSDLKHAQQNIHGFPCVSLLKWAGMCLKLLDTRMYRGVLFFSFVKAEQNKSRRIKQRRRVSFAVTAYLISAFVSTSSVSILSRSDIPSF